MQLQSGVQLFAGTPFKAAAKKANKNAVARLVKCSASQGERWHMWEGRQNLGVGTAKFIVNTATLYNWIAQGALCARQAEQQRVGLCRQRAGCAEEYSCSTVSLPCASQHVVNASI